MDARIPFLTIAMGLATFPSANAFAGSVYVYDATSSYQSVEDSPFHDAYLSDTHAFWLEDFEDGELNTPGVTASNGRVRRPGSHTDSVDTDGDAVVDANGTTGHSFLVKQTNPDQPVIDQNPQFDGPSIRFTFDADELGQLPTLVGLVWTDGNEHAEFAFQVIDRHGHSLGTMMLQLGDGVHTGDSTADRFLGATWADGISAIELRGTIGGIEVDHLQYGYELAVVPVPPAVLIGGLGVVGVALRRRRTQAARI